MTLIETINHGTLTFEIYEPPLWFSDETKVDLLLLDVEDIIRFGSYSDKDTAKEAVLSFIGGITPTLYRATYSLVDGDLDVDEFFSGLFAYDPELIIRELKDWAKELYLDISETDVLEIENVGKWVIQVGVQQVDVLKENPNV